LECFQYSLKAKKLESNQEIRELDIFPDNWTTDTQNFSNLYHPMIEEYLQYDIIWKTGCSEG
jgi:hypothetical protein